MRNVLKGIATLSVAAALSLAVAGCGGSAPQQSDAPAGASEPVVQFENTSGATIHLDATTQEATVDVEIADGEALVIMADFGDEMTDEITATTYHNGEEYTTDFFYGGQGYSETGAEPGSYTVEINAGGAEGTMWVLAYPADQVDVMNTDAEVIIDQVLSSVS